MKHFFVIDPDGYVSMTDEDKPRAESFETAEGATDRVLELSEGRVGEVWLIAEAVTEVVRPLAAPQVKSLRKGAR